MATPGSKEFDLQQSKCVECGILTRAGFPPPTISSKLLGVKSITLFANAPLRREKMHAKSEKLKKDDPIILRRRTKVSSTSSEGEGIMNPQFARCVAWHFLKRPQTLQMAGGCNLIFDGLPGL